VESFQKTLAFLVGLFLVLFGILSKCPRIGSVVVGFLLMGVFTMPEAIRIIRGENLAERNNMGGIGDMSKEEAEKLEAEGAAQTAQQQAEFAETQKDYTGEAPSVDPSTVSDEDLLARGLASWTTMTSPGGPWHGLPLAASTDQTHPDWDENCRWACVQGSYFVCTVDGTTEIGDHAENVRCYGIPQDPEGTGYMRSISTLPEEEKIRKCIEQGNLIAYRGDNIGYTLAG
jgi:Sec-independent protein translocase protein TatA